MGRRLAGVDVVLDQLDLGLDAGVVGAQPLDPAVDVRQVQRLDRDAAALQQLLAEAHGVEGRRPRAQEADAQAAQAAHHPADRPEALQVSAKRRAFRVHGVPRGQAVFDAVLVQVVAGRHLAAERVAPPVQVHLGHVVVEGVDQHRHVQRGPAQRVGDGPLVAEVGQRHQHAVDAVTVLLEEVGAALRVVEALDAAIGRLLGRKGYHVEAFLRQHLQHGLASALTEMAGEKAAVADDEAKGDRGHGAYLLVRWMNRERGSEWKRGKRWVDLRHNQMSATNASIDEPAGRALTNNQLRLDPDRLMFLVVVGAAQGLDDADQLAHRLAAKLMQILVDGGERGAKIGCFGHAVKADHGQVARDLAAAATGYSHQTQGHLVVGHKDASMSG